MVTACGALMHPGRWGEVPVKSMVIESPAMVMATAIGTGSSVKPSSSM